MNETSTTGLNSNDADASFAMQMVAHHEQAIEMAQTILDKPDIDPRVTELAQNIRKAQAPEIDTLNSWLSTRGVPDDVSTTDSSGTTSADDMAALEASSALDASRLFLEQMIVHHKGAIETATVESRSGQNADALALAGKIVQDQIAEITLMKDILTSL